MHAIRVVCPLSHLGMVAAENVVTLLKEGVHELFPDALPCAFSDAYGLHAFVPFILPDRNGPCDDGYKSALPSRGEAPLDAFA